MENLLDDKVISTIQDLSGVGYTIQEIAEVVEIDTDKLLAIMEDKNSPITRAYLAGKNMLKYKTRKSIADLAANGSMPAAMKMLEIIQTQESHEGCN